MPELPEVEAALEFLRVRARGRTIERVRLLHPALQRRLAPAQLRALVGARIARDRLIALRYSTEVVEDVTKLVELHLRFHTYRMGWTDSAVRRYVRDAGDLLEDLNELTRSDCTTRDARKADALAHRMDELEARIAELREQEELAKIKPPLGGRRVMEFLGVAPGPIVGRALAFLLDLRLDEGPMTEEDAYARLGAWAKEQGIDVEPGARETSY